MAHLAANEPLQAIDDNRDPIVGAQLFTYVAGSSTKQTTYQNSNSSTPNSNPIVFDAAGRAPYPVWLTDGVSYKFVLAPANDTDPPTSPIWTIDNITGINDTAISLDQWVSGPTPTYVSATSFTLAGDQTSTFTVGRRIKTTNSGGTVYSTITASVFGALTTVTVANDSGTLDAGLSAVSYALLSATNPSVPFALTLLTPSRIGANGDALIADSNQSVGALWVPQYPLSLAPNPFFQVNQRQNGGTNADDTYTLDRWYALTQSNPITVTLQNLQENGQATNARLTQSNAVAQRMGHASIIEATDSQPLRGKTITFRPRVRISTSQAVRIAVLEWTGGADSVTSDVVNDWTSSTYTAGNFFLGANLTVAGVGVKTPSAATWTDMDALTVSVSSSCNNIIIFVWTEGTAAQNLTLDMGKMRLVFGSYAGEIQIPRFSDTLRYCQRFFQKSFIYSTAPAQNVGVLSGEYRWQQINGAGTATRTSIILRPNMRGTPTCTGYNPAAANAEARNITGGTDNSSTSVTGESETLIEIASTTNGGSASGNLNGLHWTAVNEL